MNKLIAIFIGVFCTGSLLAQQTEPVFTQFYNTPLQVNPANAGLFAGRARIATNFKRQWENIGAPFQTTAVSADFQVARDVLTSDFFGLGLDVIQDVTGSGQSKSFGANLSGAYTRAMDSKKTHFASVGFQAGYGQRSITSSNLTWGSQWTNTGFDQTIKTSDALMDEVANYFDIGVGANYFYSQRDDKLKLYVGVAMFHANEPKISFLGNDDLKMQRKFNINGGLKYQFGHSDNFSVYPNFIYSWQGPNQVLVYGTDVEYRISGGSRSTGTRKYTSFALGLYHRWNSMISPVLKLHKAGFSLYVSYDYDMGNITRITDGKGGMEIALKYRVGFRSGKDKRNINNAFI